MRICNAWLYTIYSEIFVGILGRLMGLGVTVQNEMSEMQI